jgi:hypothetical protein
MCLWAHFAEQNRVCAGAIGSGFHPSHTRLSLSVFSLSVSRSVSDCLSPCSNTQGGVLPCAWSSTLRRFGAARRHRTRRKPRHMTTRVPTPRALPTQIPTLLTARAPRKGSKGLPPGRAPNPGSLSPSPLRRDVGITPSAGRAPPRGVTQDAARDRPPRQPAASAARSIDGERSQAVRGGGAPRSSRYACWALLAAPAPRAAPQPSCSSSGPARVDSALRHHFVHGQPQVRPVTRRWSHGGLRLDDLRDFEEACNSTLEPWRPTTRRSA